MSWNWRAPGEEMDKDRKLDLFINAMKHMVRNFNTRGPLEKAIIESTGGYDSFWGDRTLPDFRRGSTYRCSTAVVQWDSGQRKDRT
jgi:hypothetical protein